MAAVLTAGFGEFGNELLQIDWQQILKFSNIVAGVACLLQTRYHMLFSFKPKPGSTLGHIVIWINTHLKKIFLPRKQESESCSWQLWMSNFPLHKCGGVTSYDVTMYLNLATPHSFLILFSEKYRLLSTIYNFTFFTSFTHHGNSPIFSECTQCNLDFSLTFYQQQQIFSIWTCPTRTFSLLTGSLVLLPMFTQTVYTLYSTVQPSTVLYCTELDLWYWRDAFKRRHRSSHTDHTPGHRHTHGQSSTSPLYHACYGNRLED